MEKEKRCIDLVHENFEDRYKTIHEALQNLYDGKDSETGFFDIGLSFDFVPSFTFDEQEEDYFRWQLSWGGPSDEFRIYTDNENNITRIEYWYMDWFDGASVECTQNPAIREAVLLHLDGFEPAYQLQA